MYDFVDDLVKGIDVVHDRPDYFWLSDLARYVNLTGIHHLPFNQQLDKFLSIPLINELHGTNVLRDENGDVVASRLFLNIVGLDVSDVHQQIETLEQQREITEEQPINTETDRSAFFTYTSEYRMWEFYASCVDELIGSAFIGVATVSFVALMLIPHWSASLLVFPLMCILYIDMLGMMHWAGITINPVSFVILTMSIGLLVDFIMHILLKYYELPGNRREKVLGTLQTMGSSILLGGITTFLGTVPLVLSTSHVFYTVFVAFSGLVFLGASHGLILVPVLLSTFGSEEQVCSSHRLPSNCQEENHRKNTEDTAASFELDG